MANVKITELTALNAAETAATDVFPIVDVDADATKKISVSDLLRGAPDGTLSAPGFAFANDSNSGLYRIGTDNIALVTNGAARILIDANGDVTIPNNLTIQGATTYAFAAGTAAAPSITFVDDSDTGLYRPAANEIGLATAGTDRVRIDSSGNVGIGTTSPGENLHIKDTGYAGIIVQSNRTTATDNIGGIIYRDTNGINKSQIRGTVGGNLVFDTDTTPRLTITSTGNAEFGGRLLVGTTTEGYDSADNFTVADSGNCGVTIRSGASNLGTIAFSDATSGAGEYAGYIQYSQASAYMAFATNGTERMRIDSSGMHTITASNNSTAVQIRDASNYAGQLITATDGTFEINARTATRFTRTGSALESMRITSSGNVGIGTTSPSTTLDVKASSASTYVAQFADSATTEPAKIYVDANGVGFVRGNFDDGIEFASNTARIYVNGSERMRINSSGNVGIGTTSPSAKLHATGEIRYGSNTTYYGTIDHDAASTGANIYNSVDSGGHIFKRNNTIEQMRIDGSGDVEVMQGKNLTWVFAGGSTHRARIRAESTDALIFENGSGDTERMRIDSSGNVGIGTISPSFGAIDHGVHISGSGAQEGIRLETTNGSGGILEIYSENGGNTLDTRGSGYIRFNNATTEWGRWDSSGRLLLNTTTEGHSDADNLTVADSSKAGITIRNTTTTGDGAIFFSDATSGTAEYAGYIEYGHSTNYLRFATSSAERMRIDSSGRVGIGTASPAHNLDISPASGAAELKIAGAEGQEASIRLYADQGDDAADIKKLLTDTSGNFKIQRYVGSAFVDSMVIDSSGNVRIGTTSPSVPLEVSSSSFDSFKVVRTGAGTGAKIGLVNGDGNEFQIIHDGGEDLIFRYGSSAERMRIDSSGNVGIGTTSPRGLVHLHSSSAPRLDLTNTATGTGSGDGATISVDSSTGALNIIQRESQPIQLYTSNTERMRIDSSGNVGIGTSSPAQKFHVLTQGTAGGIIAQFENSYTGNFGGLRILGGVTDRECRFQSLFGSSFFTFYTEGTGAATERMRIDSDGRLLIGGTSTADDDHANINANGVLTIRRAAASNDCIVIKEGSTESLLIEAAGNVYNYNVGSFAFTSWDNEFGVSGPYASLGSFGGEARISAGSTASDDVPLVFRTASSGTLGERVRIDSSGRLLVGTSSAQTIGNSQAQLEVSTDSSTGYALSLSRSVADIYGPQINFRSTRGTAASPVIVSDNDQLGSIAFYGYDGTDSNHQHASIAAHVDGTPGLNDCPGRLVFSTTADGASSPTERMRIANNGVISSDNCQYLYFRNESTTTSTLTLKKDVAGADNVDYIQCRNSSNSAKFIVEGDGDVRNATNVYAQISDQKLKENIVAASSQWDDLKNLRVVNFNFTEVSGHPTHTQIGLVAQEVEIVSPGLVSESIDRDEESNDLGTTTKSVKYSVLYMKAVKALQEAMERIETLEAKVAALEAS